MSWFWKAFWGKIGWILGEVGLVLAVLVAMFALCAAWIYPSVSPMRKALRRTLEPGFTQERNCYPTINPIGTWARP